MDKAKKYLEDMVKIQKMITNPDSSRKYEYMSGSEFILKNGVQCIPRAYNVDEFKGVPRIKRECYRNAYYLAWYTGLIYVEGIGINIIGTEHAWCIDSDFNVYDPTWDNPEKHSYYGVPFDLDYVEKIMHETEVYGVLQNWTQRFPLFTGEHTDFKHKFENNESRRN